VCVCPRWLPVARDVNAIPTTRGDPEIQLVRRPNVVLRPRSCALRNMEAAAVVNKQDRPSLCGLFGQYAIWQRPTTVQPQHKHFRPYCFRLQRRRATDRHYDRKNSAWNVHSPLCGFISVADFVRNLSVENSLHRVAALYHTYRKTSNISPRLLLETLHISETRLLLKYCQLAIPG